MFSGAACLESVDTAKEYKGAKMINNTFYLVLVPTRDQQQCPRFVFCSLSLVRGNMEESAIRPLLHRGAYHGWLVSL